MSEYTSLMQLLKNKTKRSIMSDIKSELESLELTHSGVIFGHLWSSLVILGHLGSSQAH